MKKKRQTFSNPQTGGVGTLDAAARTAPLGFTVMDRFAGMAAERMPNGNGKSRRFGRIPQKRTRHGAAAGIGRVNGDTTGGQGVSGGQFQSKEEKSLAESYLYKRKVTPSDPLTPTSPPGSTDDGRTHRHRGPAETAPAKNRKKLEQKLQKAKECILRADSGLSLEQAVAVLDRLRRAFRAWDAARRELLEGLLPLVRDAAPDVWGALWIGLATAIDRLTRNEEPDLLKSVVEELERSEREFWCSESGHIYPPPSTNSTRKQRGKAPHPALRRQPGNIDDSEGLSQGRRKIDRKGKRKTHWFTIPIKLPTTPEHEEQKWRPSEITTSDEDRRVLESLIAGLSQAETAEQAGLTIYRVRKIRATLQERMRRLEAENE